MAADFNPQLFIQDFFKGQNYQVDIKIIDKTQARIFISNKAGRDKFTAFLDLHLLEVYNQQLLESALQEIKNQIEQF